LKWGVLFTLALWSICLIIEYIIFAFYSVKEQFPKTPIDTSLTTTLHWGSFLLGFWAFSLMLLAWANVVRSINITENGLIRFMRRQFPYVTIFGMVATGFAIVSMLIVVGANLPNIPTFTSLAAITICVNLIIQSIGYSYYCIRILQHTRAREHNATNSKRNDMNMKLTILAIAVIAGWVVIIAALVTQNYIVGIASHVGFWCYNLGQDICFFFVILSTFTSLNIRFTGKGSSAGESGTGGTGFGGTSSSGLTSSNGGKNIKSINTSSNSGVGVNSMTGTVNGMSSYIAPSNYSGTVSNTSYTMGPVSKYQMQQQQSQNTSFSNTSFDAASTASLYSPRMSSANGNGGGVGYGGGGAGVAGAQFGAYPPLQPPATAYGNAMMMNSNNNVNAYQAFSNVNHATPFEYAIPNQQQQQQQQQGGNYRAQYYQQQNF
jgi:hypothetical protein